MIYLFIADGFEEIEALCCCDYLRRCKKDVSLVSIGPGLARTGAHGIRISCDIPCGQCRLSDAEMLVLPGGMPGTVHLSESAELKKLLLAAKENKIPLAAICAAPSVLGGLGLLRGVSAVCFPGFEDKLIGASVAQGGVCFDRSADIITGRSMGFALEFSYALACRCAGKETANAVWDSLVTGRERPMI